MKRLVHHFGAAILAAVVLLAAVGLFAATPASAAVLTASAVVGQAGDFTLSNGGSASVRFSNPSANVVDPVRHRMFVADTSNNRVSVFNLNANNTLPDEVADRVLGQTAFNVSTSGTTQSTFDAPRGLIYDASRDRLFVADSGNNRVMVFDTSTINNGMNALYVLGQADFTSKVVGTTQAGISVTRGLALSPDNRWLFVTDENNRRVMVWDSNALGVGANATYVIGQSGFTATAFTVSQSTLIGPAAVAVDAATNRFFVAELSNNRVTVFNLANLGTNMAADYVVGQSSFTTNGSGLSQTALNAPIGIATGAGRVWVTDQNNHRVVSFPANVAANGASFVDVIGQPNFTTGGVNTGGRSASSLAYPTGISFDSGTYRLLVTDSLNNRLLAFDPVVQEVQVALGVAPSFTFTVAGRATACNGVTPTGTASATSANLGMVNGGSTTSAAQDLTVASNANGGFVVYQRGAALVGPRALTDVAGTNASPAAFGSGERFGYTVDDTDVAGFTGPLWAALSNTNATVMRRPSGVTASETNCVAYQAATTATTPAGNYTTTVVYTAVPTF